MIPKNLSKASQQKWKIICNARILTWEATMYLQLALESFDRYSELKTIPDNTKNAKCWKLENALFEDYTKNYGIFLKLAGFNNPEIPQPKRPYHRDPNKNQGGRPGKYTYESEFGNK
jgi:hypothetical protein